MTAMSRQQIALPWRSIGEPWRDRHLETLIAHYSQDFDVIVADNEGAFNRSAARNEAVRQTESDIAVIIDADNYIPLEQIHDAIDTARELDCMVKPFVWFGYMTEESTIRFYNGDTSMTHVEWQNPPGREFTGGAYVVPKDIWDYIGGADENFKGWGGEDDAIHLQCHHLKVPVVYTYGYDYHMYHPAERVVSQENLDLLFGKYVNRAYDDANEIILD